MSSAFGSPAPVFAAPQRIRVVSHPPLPPLRAWLPLGGAGMSTIAHLSATVANMLGTRQGLGIELQGFALLHDSPLSVLDPANDILDIKISPSAPPPEVESRTNTQPTAARLAPTEASLVVSTSDSSSSADSSSDSDSDSSDDSSSDSEPEKLSSKPSIAPASELASAPKLNGGLKRPRSPSFSSGSSSSSGSSAPRPVPTTPPVSAAAAAISARIAAHLASQSRVASAPIPPASVSPLKPGVPPGHGLKRTKSRNARKRLLKASREKEDEERRERERKVREELAKEEEGGMEMDEPVGTTAPTPAPAPAEPPTATSTAATLTPTTIPKLLPDPYASLYGPQLDMLHLASGNKNKRKTLVGIGHDGRRAKKGKRTKFFDEPQLSGNGDEFGQDEEIEMELAKDGTAQWGAKARLPAEVPLPPSPKHIPSSPPHSPNIALVHPSTSSTPGPLPITVPAAPERLPPPSKRRDLPPNVTVTRVDVEAKKWIAGRGRVVEGTSEEWKGWARGVHRFSATSADSVLPREDKGKGKEVEAKQELETTADEEDWGPEWIGWPSLARVEAGWEAGRWQKLGAAEAGKKVGSRVVTKVLELNPLTFAPSLSTKYGVLLPSTASSSSASPSAGGLRMQLHPSCLPDAEDCETYEEGAGGSIWDGEQDYASRDRPKFGMGVAIDEDGEGEGREAPQQEGVWEGEWGDVRLLA